MPNIELEIGAAGDRVPIDKLPTTALQAIYHAVTGKTESMTKQLTGSVIIERKDVQNLHGMLLDQLGQYQAVCDPTVTIVTKYDNDKSVTYSSWERFQALQVHHLDVTSEILIKIEVVLRLPSTPIDQRLVISIVLDSALPIIRKMGANGEEVEAFGFFLFIRKDWQTVKLSIDFVDFLVARAFSGVVEEWFDKLAPTPKSSLNNLILTSSDTIASFLRESPRVGMAVFVASFVIFKGSQRFSITEILYGLSLALFIWSILAVASSALMRSIRRRTVKNIVPTVIILTDGDERAYNEIKSARSSAGMTIGYVFLAAIFNILLNIISSYIYSGSQ